MKSINAGYLWIIILLLEKKKTCQKWDSNPRPHTRTRTLILWHRGRGFLESGALDRSAILTRKGALKIKLLSQYFTTVISLNIFFDKNLSNGKKRKVQFCNYSMEQNNRLKIHKFLHFIPKILINDFALLVEGSVKYVPSTLNFEKGY